jgi:hypothetical protein
MKSVVFQGINEVKNLNALKSITDSLPEAGITAA